MATPATLDVAQQLEAELQRAVQPVVQEPEDPKIAKFRRLIEASTNMTIVEMRRCVDKYLATVKIEEIKSRMN